MVFRRSILDSLIGSFETGTNDTNMFCPSLGEGYSYCIRFSIMSNMVLAWLFDKLYPLANTSRYLVSQSNNITPPPQFNKPQIYFFNVIYFISDWVLLFFAGIKSITYPARTNFVFCTVGSKMFQFLIKWVVHPKQPMFMVCCL